jgi:uncharacterized protein
MKEEWEYASVILCGSLIAELHRGAERRPVGRKEFLEIWPLSFKEFLKAVGNEVLFEFLSSYKLSQPIPQKRHEKLIRLFNEYLKGGGLPEVVKTFLEGGISVDEQILGRSRVF